MPVPCDDNICNVQIKGFKLFTDIAVYIDNGKRKR